MSDESAQKEDEAFEERLHGLRPLPTGVEEFEAWSDLIIEDCGLTASRESLKHTLAAMILQLGNGEAFKPNSHFISALRKAAANQVAQHMMAELNAKKKAALDAQLAAKQKADNDNKIDDLNR